MSELPMISRLTPTADRGSLFALFSGVQIPERRRHPGGEWEEETLPGRGPRAGESHPFDGLLRKLHQLLNPQPRPSHAGLGSGEQPAEERNRWS
jgi:hypothetical protein